MKVKTLTRRMKKQQTIKKLKNKKAPENDSITNKMIECTDDIMLVELKKPFNKIFQAGYYPNSWNEGLIFSIHKSGEKENPNNFPCITLSISLGKLFITNMPISKLQNENILSPAQARFCKDHRTSDHIFTLFSIIKKAFHTGKISIYLLC